MNLVEALETVELEAGRTYRCRIRGLSIEVRVDTEPPDSDLEKSDPPDSEQDDSESSVIEDAPMDSWFELPSPKSIGKLTPVFRPLPLPVRYEIPPDGDKPS